jgi:hypothetical protein
MIAESPSSFFFKKKIVLSFIVYYKTLVITCTFNHLDSITIFRFYVYSYEVFSIDRI